MCALLGAYTYQALVPGGDSSHSNDRRRLLYTGVCVCVCVVFLCVYVCRTPIQMIVGACCIQVCVCVRRVSVYICL